MAVKEKPTYSQTIYRTLFEHRDATEGALWGMRRQQKYLLWYIVLYSGLYSNTDALACVCIAGWLNRRVPCAAMTSAGAWTARESDSGRVMDSAWQHSGGITRNICAPAVAGIAGDAGVGNRVPNRRRRQRGDDGRKRICKRLALEPAAPHRWHPKSVAAHARRKYQSKIMKTQPAISMKMAARGAYEDLAAAKKNSGGVTI